MKVKKITALAIGAAMVGSVLGASFAAAQKVDAPNGIPQLNIKNVEVVIPTTPEVNGIPLHIKNDAASAVLLVTDIYKDSVLMDIDVLEKSLSPVEVGGQLSNKIKDTDAVIGIVTKVKGDSNPSTPDVDIDGHWYVPQLDIPIQDISDAYYDNGDPVNKVGFGVDFSKISWIDPASGSLTAPEEKHKGEWELGDGAIKIGWALKWSPLKPNAEDDVVLSQKKTDNGNIDVIYYYKNYEPEQNPVQIQLGDSLKVNEWKIVPIDMDVDQGKAIVRVIAPNGTNTLIAVQIDPYAPYHYVFWVNSKGDLVHWSDDSLDSGKTKDIDGDGTDDIVSSDVDGVVQELEKAGVGTMFVFSPTGHFIGINGTKNIEVRAAAKELKNTYEDGEKVADIFPELKNYPHYLNWYLDIDSSNPNEPVVYFVWKSVYNPEDKEYTKFPPVFFKPGEKLYIPIPYFKNVGTEDKPKYELKTEVVVLEMDAKLDSDGKYYDPTTAEFYIEYHRDVKKYYDKEAVDDKLEELMNKVQASDPGQAIVTDEEVLKTGFEAGKDYVIIGGWISNKAWKELEKYYPEKVAEMKKYLLDEVAKGHPDFVVYVLPNPADSDHVIIVAAGSDHEQTAQAVKYIIKNMGQ